ncbi:hypothetical protein M409DRAFT_28950 [Zasmidium cellare ATCC 36951]|uniref:Zn(2)-C6 fungal-type domain-containing protein n=1 Tax=Zasmidium cellare ATCC 36951 TaxID=1080233 RepID=A0A6A6C0R3_ZASCE|nr:uncharacterized protein M409DRAFT_28950 [Zasmidium cellare ATCC 36951]KAF2160565.1 hypothetical protein M409DRAFT_28950 [Zasmidium cellare ATCC 36951]
MVHRGFSQGCHRCRAHHTRCDQRRPACSRCRLAGLQCPGYRDDGAGFLFKDQTGKVVRKGTARRNGGLKKAAAAEDFCGVLTGVITPSPEDSCVDFFFGNFMRLGTARRVECGLYPTLFPIYHHSAFDSPLRLAVTVAAGEITALSYPARHRPRHVRNVSRAIQAITAALQDPEQCGKDDLLLAVLILQKAEQAYCVRHGGRISTVHEKGAVGLIQWRRRQGKNVPEYLVAGARSSVLTSLIYGGASSDVAAETLSYLQNVETTNPPNPISLDHLLARALCLWHRATTTTTTTPLSPSQTSTLQSQLHSLNSTLTSWLSRTSPTLLSTPTPEAALLFQQYRLTLTITLSIISILHPADDGKPCEAIADLLRNMLDATGFFFEVLRGKEGRKEGVLDPTPMAATCLHLTLRFLGWCGERLGVGVGDREGEGEGLLERVREREEALRGLIGGVV